MGGDLGLEDPLPGGEGFGQLRGGGGDLGGVGDMLSGVGGGEAGPVDQLAPAQGDPIEDGYLQRAIKVVTGKTPIFVDPGEVVVDSSRAGVDWFWLAFFTIY